MTTLVRLTTRYVEQEDRLRLSGLDAAGATHVLWLTRRLADPLLAALFRLLSPPADAGAPEARVQGLMKTAQQQVASARLNPGPPVAAGPGVAPWLVTAINVTPQANAVRLEFAGDGHRAEVEIGALHLHQWLGIVFTNYRTAGWQADLWPHWFIEAQVAPAAPAVVH